MFGVVLTLDLINLSEMNTRSNQNDGTGYDWI